MQKPLFWSNSMLFFKTSLESIASGAVYGCGDQTINAMVLQHEGRGYEFAHGLSTLHI